MTLQRVFLIGPRGSGKTSIASHLANALGWQAVDADTLLELQAGRTIREIFAEEGEAGFRQREADVLRQLSRCPLHIIATGGGVVLRPENRELLRSSGFVIWLTADPETLWQRISGDSSTADRRPNLSMGGKEEVKQILADREALYRETAHICVDTSSRDLALLTEEILQRLSLVGISVRDTSGRQ